MLREVLVDPDAALAVEVVILGGGAVLAHGGAPLDVVLAESRGVVPAVVRQALVAVGLVETDVVAPLHRGHDVAASQGPVPQVHVVPVETFITRPQTVYLAVQAPVVRAVYQAAPLVVTQIVVPLAPPTQQLSIRHV